jgi:hypothetical protein
MRVPLRHPFASFLSFHSLFDGADVSVSVIMPNGTEGETRIALLACYCICDYSFENLGTQMNTGSHNTCSTAASEVKK